MIHTTLGALANAEPALKRLAEVRLPVKAAYQLSKLIRLVGAEVPYFHQQRDVYIRELGVQVGDQFTVQADGMTEFIHRMNELSEQPVDLSINPLSLDTFGSIELSATELIVLYPLLCEEAPAP